MAKKLPPETKISTTNEEQILVRNKDLVHELIGKVSFTEMFFLHLMQRMPSEGELAVFDSVLVTLMEHGLPPSAIATRLTIMSAPESVQGAISAGLQGIGSGLVGTMEGMAKNLQDIMEADERIEAICLQIATSYKKSKQAIPGFGHPFHKPDDPRTPRLFEIALNAKCLWEYVGKPGEANRTKIQKAILAAIKTLEFGGGAKASDIKDVVRKEDDSWTKEQIQVELTRLSDNGEVVKVTRGVYKSSPF